MSIPGKSGAFCCLYDDGTLDYMDFDETIHPMMEWLISIKNDHDIQMVMIEDVHAIFGSSAKSTFSFGFNTGMLHGLIRGLGLPLDLVKPKEWQKHAGVTKKGKEIKKEVAAICQRIYPLSEIHTPRGRLLDGRSDATLVAMYAKFKHK